MFRHYTIDGVPVVQTAFISRLKPGNEPELDVPGLIAFGEFLEKRYHNDVGWMIIDVDTFTVRTDQDGYVYHEHHSLYVHATTLVRRQLPGLTHIQMVTHFGCVCGLVMTLWPPLTNEPDTEELDSDSLISRFYHKHLGLIRRGYGPVRDELIYGNPEGPRMGETHLN